MRLDRVFIDGYRNLVDFEIDFDERKLTTVIIGQNGSGKSNLIEALVEIFRAADLGRGNLNFKFLVEYRIDKKKISISNKGGKLSIAVDGEYLSKAQFEGRRNEYLPDMVFGYYSGSSRRFERLFDEHQRRYYNAVKISDDAAACKAALDARRLFYCRPIHGVFALLAFFSFPNELVSKRLLDQLKIKGFHSAIAQFREPWFARARPRSERDPFQLWGAKGPAGACAREILKVAFHPIAIDDHPRDDYRDKDETESQLIAFIRTFSDLKRFAINYESDAEMFAALEAADISDLFRELLLWVVKEGDASGDVGFAEFSDGERQLLMVLGLTRISRGKRVLFLLDEPDTHLNPAWQNSYLQLIRHWSGEGEDADNCQFILTSHNPLTIAALRKEEVRVLTNTGNGRINAYQPRVDPRGLGFSGILMDVFGLASAIDAPTQDLIAQRNELARLENPTPVQARKLEDATFELGQLGISYEHRDRLYSLFLRELDKLQLAGDRPLNNEELAEIESVSRKLAEEVLSKP